MKMIWNEETIRAELRRLDGITGLHGAELPITFGNARSTLGCFHSDSNGDEMRFYFSNFWFKKPDWPDASALDVIRHEYAHYMDWMLYGHCSHGPTWKACCVQVGAVPSRLYSEETNAFYQKKEAQEQALAQTLEAYGVGSRVVHPTFGTGVIQALESSGTSQIASIAFDAGTKRFPLAWVHQHCTSV